MTTVHTPKGNSPCLVLENFSVFNFQACERILLELFAHEDSVPFHEPVPKNVPNYYRLILNPMDFTTIKSKLNKQHFNHYKSLEAFVCDVVLTFKNCLLYNAVSIVTVCLF